MTQLLPGTPHASCRTAYLVVLARADLWRQRGKLQGLIEVRWDSVLCTTKRALTPCLTAQLHFLSASF